MEAIYVIDLHNGLSKYGAIPWNSKKDLKFFYNKTKNNVVLMGKNTYFSLPVNIRPLKGRLNIVLTTNVVKYNNIDRYDNLIFTNNDKIYDSIIDNREKYLERYSFLNSDFKIFIIGGKKIYEQFIPLCETIWVTKIKKSFDCDLFLNYDYSKQYKEPEIIDDDEELTIFKYLRIC